MNGESLVTWIGMFIGASSILSCGNHTKSERLHLPTTIDVQQSLISQTRTYFRAVFDGDTGSALGSIHPGVFEYSAGESDLEPSVSRNAMAQEILNTGRIVKEAKIKFEFDVRVLRTVTDGDTVLSRVIVNTIMQSPNHKKSSWEELVAVSTNSGSDWRFIANTLDVPDILRMSFSSNLVTRIE